MKLPLIFIALIVIADGSGRPSVCEDPPRYACLIFQAKFNHTYESIYERQWIGLPRTFSQFTRGVGIAKDSNLQCLIEQPEIRKMGSFERVLGPSQESNRTHRTRKRCQDATHYFPLFHEIFAHQRVLEIVKEFRFVE